LHAQKKKCKRKKHLDIGMDIEREDIINLSIVVFLSILAASLFTIGYIYDIMFVWVIFVVVASGCICLAIYSIYRMLKNR